MEFAGAVDEAFAADLLERIRAAMAARDIDAILELATDDVVYDDMGSQEAITGKAESGHLLRPILERLESPDVRLISSFIGLDGESVAARWKITADRRQGAEPVELDYMSIYTIREGKISRFTLIFRHPGWLGSLFP